MKKVFWAVFILIASLVRVWAEGEMEGTNSYSQIIDRDSQWDFFKNVIPRQKSITVSGSSWKIIIDDKYKVTFSGSWKNNSNEHIFSKSEGSRVSKDERWGNRGNATFSGVGFVAWADEKIKIELIVTGRGSYESRMFSTRASIQDWLEVTSIMDYFADGNTSINCVFGLQPEYKEGIFTGRLMLGPSRDIALQMTGSTSHTASIKVGGNSWLTATVVAKTESELNASANDEFGEWDWNADRTRLFLKSQSSDNKFVILNNDGTLIWSIEIVKNAKGSSESTTDSGDKVVNLAMSFDGAPVQNFSFVENTEELPDSNFIQLDYAAYNRFLGSLDKNPETVLNQIKEKQMLILTYTANNTQRTDMFILDGLVTILDYLKR